MYETQYLKTSHIIQVRVMLDNVILGTCPVNSFRCNNKRCIQVSRVCDGTNDCQDNSDEEEGCHGKNYIKSYLYRLKFSFFDSKSRFP